MYNRVLVSIHLPQNILLRINKHAMIQIIAESFKIKIKVHVLVAKTDRPDWCVIITSLFFSPRMNIQCDIWSQHASDMPYGVPVKTTGNIYSKEG